MVGRMRTVLQFGGSFGAGAVAGALYFALQAQAPAPPWPALVGLLGILSGESLGRRVINRLGVMRGRRSSDPERYAGSGGHP